MTTHLSLTRWLAAVALVACASAAAPEPEVLTLEVGPETVACIAEGPRRCLLVRRPPDGAWTRFYDPIEGFAHEPGYRVRIEVARQRVINPPADASSWRYRLVRVLARERIP